MSLLLRLLEQPKHVAFTMVLNTRRKDCTKLELAYLVGCVSDVHRKKAPGGEGNAIIVFGVGICIS